MLYFYDDLFLRHDTGYGHPENPGRLAAIMERLHRQSWFSRLRLVTKRFATKKEILANHSESLFEELSILARKGGGSVDGDTHLGPDSLEAALLAAGAGLAAVDAILDQNSDVQKALLLLRPPGHHARKNQAMGFCLFNNIAIAAHHLKNKGLERIAILDWDVHHGNGTEESFYEDPSVLYVSIHQEPCYPGTGKAQDLGRNAGEGFNLNVPLPPGSDDSDYQKAFESRILPALHGFEPEILLVSAGFDAHARDPLAQMQVSSAFFEWATKKTLDATKPTTHGKTISFLEGGYHHEALAESVELHAAALLQA